MVVAVTVRQMMSFDTTDETGCEVQ